MPHDKQRQVPLLHGQAQVINIHAHTMCAVGVEKMA
jgi:hypothetical protein